MCHVTRGHDVDWALPEGLENQPLKTYGQLIHPFGLWRKTCMLLFVI